MNVSESKGGAKGKPLPDLPVEESATASAEVVKVCYYVNLLSSEPNCLMVPFFGVYGVFVSHRTIFLSLSFWIYQMDDVAS